MQRKESKRKKIIKPKKKCSQNTSKRLSEITSDDRKKASKKSVLMNILLINVCVKLPL